MNKDTIEGNWKQLKGKVKEQWGKLTYDDFDVIAGKRDQLLGRIRNATASAATRPRNRSRTGSRATAVRPTRSGSSAIERPLPCLQPNSNHLEGELP